jgi:glycine cleavage system H protein
MSSVPEDLKYSEEHEWVRLDGDTARIGITEYAQDQLGDIVYVDLPSTGTKVTVGKTFGVVESVKAASDVFSPLSGAVKATNERLTDEPELVNSDPYGDGWMVELEIADPDELKALMDAGEYEDFLAEQE